MYKFFLALFLSIVGIYGFYMIFMIMRYQYRISKLIDRGWQVDSRGNCIGTGGRKFICRYKLFYESWSIICERYGIREKSKWKI